MVAARRATIALVVANVLSAVGNPLTMIALPLYVFATTGSAARTGLVAVFQMIPFIVASFVGGGIVDRVGPKRISVLSDVMSGVSIAAIPILASLGELELWHILGLAALGALLDGPGVTALFAAIGAENVLWLDGATFLVSAALSWPTCPRASATCAGSGCCSGSPGSSSSAT